MYSVERVEELRYLKRGLSKKGRKGKKRKKSNGKLK